MEVGDRFFLNTNSIHKKRRNRERETLKTDEDQDTKTLRSRGNSHAPRGEAPRRRNVFSDLFNNQTIISNISHVPPRLHAILVYL